MTRIAKSCLLLFFFSLCAAAIMIGYRAPNPAITPAPRELYSVVNNQLAAFRTADFSRAYRNASTRVQQKFSLPQFEGMIRRNYAEMIERQRVEFGLVQVRGETAILQVFFFAEDGKARSFLYSFVAEDGTWRIEGVEQVQLPQSRQAGLHI